MGRASGTPSADIAAAVRAFQDGDERARELLVRRACELAVRTAAALTNGREQADEISQDVAVDVLRSLAQLEHPEAFDAWVHRITVRHALRFLKRRGRSRGAETPLALIGDETMPASGAGPSPDDLVVLRAALTDALAELPDRQRIAVALRYIHDLPDEEIATALRCRVGTVHALLSRARSTLRTSDALVGFATTEGVS